MPETITIFKNAFSKEPHYIGMDKALLRVQNGASKILITEIRNQIGKEGADRLKRNLPSVCFSGRFGAERKDDTLIEHSGYLICDFDEVPDLRNRQSEIISHDFVKACWVSPRGNGLKALIRIADGKRHREHFTALLDIFPEMDKTSINPSRICFESYDPDIYIADSVKPFAKLKTVERIQTSEALNNEQEIFIRILKWLANKGGAFVTGERNIFIFKLASACCRFGISEQGCTSLCISSVVTGDNSFSVSECQRTVRSAYKANKNNFGSAVFEKSILIDKVSKSEVSIDLPDSASEIDLKPKDVIFGEDVKGKAIDIYKFGYQQISGIGIPEIDQYFKLRRTELTLLSGIGNYGKSSFLKFYLLMRILLYGERFAFFSPEDNPAEEFYHDCVEILLGCDCTPANPNRPKQSIYEEAYDYVSRHVYFVYPKDIAPTPEYIKERFLELIIKENIDGVIIDPFNQLSNDYGKAGGRSDKYLETFLSDCLRFAAINNIYFLIIAHPKALRKEADGNYPCPDLFDIADGAMWNNKVDNMLVYHRPNHQKDPMSAHCELHSKKIRRQKIVGKKGTANFEMVRKFRRYFFDGIDYMQRLLNEKGFTFQKEQAAMSFIPKNEIVIDEDDWTKDVEDQSNNF